MAVRFQLVEVPSVEIYHERARYLHRAPTTATEIPRRQNETMPQYSGPALCLHRAHHPTELEQLCAAPLPFVQPAVVERPWQRLPSERRPGSPHTVHPRLEARIQARWNAAERRNPHEGQVGEHQLRSVDGRALHQFRLLVTSPHWQSLHEDL